MSIKKEIQTIIASSLDRLSIEYTNIEVDIPNDSKNGDYASNIALTLARSLHKSPMEIAKTIKENINSEMIDHIDIATPGFINFFIKKDYLLNIINEIIAKGNKYGSSNIGNSKKMNLEFVSANPTGTLHVGHARGATYGDNLARILSFIGYDVTKEYYINDAGNQMYNLGVSICERYKEVCGEQCNLPENGYHGKEIIDIAKNIYDLYGNKKINEDVEFFKKAGLEILLDAIKKDLDEYRVNFDVFTSEQSLYDKGIVDEILNELRDSNECYIKEDALWLKTTDFGDDKDRVIVKSDGSYTYCLPDIAYHFYKFNRGFDELYTIVGADHHGSTARVKAGLKILNQDTNRLNYKLIQMVRLIKDGEELKLSKRTGKTITLKDLIEEVGINATRYFFSSKNIDSQMDFNIDLALKETNDNPIYYIEYANARICSILRNYKKDVQIKEKYNTLNNENTYIILNKLAGFGDIVASAGTKELPHLVANYVYELASMFHTYYASEKIITDDQEYTEERIALLKAIKIVINNALDLIGIIPREEM